MNKVQLMEKPIGLNITDESHSETRLVELFVKTSNINNLEIRNQAMLLERLVDVLGLGQVREADRFVKILCALHIDQIHSTLVLV